MAATLKGRIKRLTAAGAVVAVAATALVSAGCGDDDGSKAASNATATSTLPQGSEPVKLDPADFTTRIDNEYWPMKPGSRWVYREYDGEGTEQRVVVTVTNRTKQIANGVTARVVRDVVTEGGKPVEKTDDWYAQDKDGNIWYQGEATQEFENGKPTTTKGSFEAGVDGAQAGIIMPAEPKPGLSYRQEYYKGEAEDEGKIVATDTQAEVPAGHYQPTVMTQDTNPLEPKVLEFKFFARGVGPVLAIGVSGGSDREELIRYEPAK